MTSLPSSQILSRHWCLPSRGLCRSMFHFVAADQPSFNQCHRVCWWSVPACRNIESDWLQTSSQSRGWCDGVYASSTTHLHSTTAGRLRKYFLGIPEYLQDTMVMVATSAAHYVANKFVMYGMGKDSTDQLMWDDAMAARNALARWSSGLHITCFKMTVINGQKTW